MRTPPPLPGPCVYLIYLSGSRILPAGSGSPPFSAQKLLNFFCKKGFLLKQERMVFLNPVEKKGFRSDPAAFFVFKLSRFATLVLENHMSRNSTYCMNLFNFSHAAVFLLFFCFPFRNVPGTVRRFSFTRDLGILLISWQHYITFSHRACQRSRRLYVVPIRKHMVFDLEKKSQIWCLENKTVLPFT